MRPTERSALQPRSPRDRLIVFGFRDTEMAARVARQVLTKSWSGLGRDALAVVSCDQSNRDRVTTYGQPLGVGPWGRFWSAALLQPSTFDPSLHARVRAYLLPGTSALCVAVGSTAAAALIEEIGALHVIVFHPLAG